MNVPQYASAAAKLLRRFLPTAETVVGDRERGLATLERAVRVRARRRRLQWLGAGLATAASVLLAVGLLRWTRASGDARAQVSIQGSPAGRGAAVRTGEQARPLSQRAELTAGQRIETPQAGGASLQLSTGTAMDLADSTSFRVDSQGTTEHFTLERGRLSAHVAKLASGQRFIVATPDAEVEVRGTRFRLQALELGETCASGTRTRLEVSEGVVEVRARGTTTSVTAGQHWPPDCDQSPPAAFTRTPASDSTEPPKSARPRRPASALSPVAPAGRRDLDAPSAAAHQVDSSAPRAPEPGSALSAANDLFAEAVALRRQGDAEGALRTYQAVIARFPASPLAENARAERMRVLASTRDPRAPREAELYLSRYPKGFAANEARLLTVTP